DEPDRCGDPGEAPAGGLRLACSAKCPFRTHTRHSRRGRCAAGYRLGGVGRAAASCATPVAAPQRPHAVLGSTGSVFSRRRFLPGRPLIGCRSQMSMNRLKRASLTVVYLTVAAGALGTVKKSRTPEAAVVHALTASREQSAAGSVGRALFVAPPTDLDEPDRAAVRRKLRHDEQGTYIAEILQLRDSSLARWPDRGDRPLTVWIQPTTKVDDWMPGYVDRVREAFE